MGASESKPTSEPEPEPDPLDLPADPTKLPYFDSEIGWVWDKAKKHDKAFKVMLQAGLTKHAQQTKAARAMPLADRVRLTESREQRAQRRAARKADKSLDAEVRMMDDQLDDEEEALESQIEKLRGLIKRSRETFERDQRRKNEKDQMRCCFCAGANPDEASVPTN